MRMFINGLKYIIPCHNRQSRKSIEQFVIEQYQSISTTVKNCLKDHRLSTIDERAKQAFSQLKGIFIQRLLRHRSNIVIHRTDKSKVFYIGKVTGFERKAEEYILKTEAYKEISNSRCPLSDILYAVQTLLTHLVIQKGLTDQQRTKISPKLHNLELGHYHGLPKPHKPGTPLRPIIACIHGSTSSISKFVNDLLAPIFLNVAREATFINGIDAIRKLEKYVLDQYFQSTTKFVTVDVTDLYRMIPREGASQALMRF
ncbi:unnamed protein product [Rotaria sp. Silwood2]|nr:unnamed protein product [Rotaria sp. Silwood2]